MPDEPFDPYTLEGDDIALTDVERVVRWFGLNVADALTIRKHTSFSPQPMNLRITAEHNRVMNELQEHYPHLFAHKSDVARTLMDIGAMVMSAWGQLANLDFTADAGSHDLHDAMEKIAEFGNQIAVHETQLDGWLKGFPDADFAGRMDLEWGLVIMAVSALLRYIRIEHPAFNKVKAEAKLVLRRFHVELEWYSNRVDNKVIDEALVVLGR